MPLNNVSKDRGYFSGRRVLVTGAANGIGRGLSLELLSRGAQVFATDIDGDGLANLATTNPANSDSLIIHCADLRVAGVPRSIVEHAIAALGAIEILIVSAGVVTTSRHKTATEIADTISVNLSSALQVMTAAANHSASDRETTIVAMSSLASRISPARMFDYSASKAGLDAAIRSMRCGDDKHVRILQVNCGFVGTGMVSELKWRPFCVSVDYAVAKILRAVERGKSRCVFPPFAGIMISMARWLPRSTVRALERRILPDTETDSADQSANLAASKGSDVSSTKIKIGGRA